MVTTIGILSLQGGFAEHIHHLKRCGVQTREVRLPKDLQGIKGLIIPGGESTTIVPLLQRWGLFQAIQQQMSEEGLLLWGTCAGAILLAKRVTAFQFPTLGYIHMTVDRNAYGAQSASFETVINLDDVLFGKASCASIFIRAPRIIALDKNVSILGRLVTGEIVAVEQGNCMATTFHPELTDDSCFHEYFVKG